MHTQASVHADIIRGLLLVEECRELCPCIHIRLYVTAGSIGRRGVPARPSIDATLSRRQCVQ
jgi:hypothetical protein